MRRAPQHTYLQDRNLGRGFVCAGCRKALEDHCRRHQPPCCPKACTFLETEDFARLLTTATQAEVAKAYARALKDPGPAGPAGEGTRYWTVINNAIMTRWGIAALKRIKRDAWAIAGEE